MYTNVRKKDFKNLSRHFRLFKKKIACDCIYLSNENNILTCSFDISISIVSNPFSKRIFGNLNLFISGLKFSPMYPSEENGFITVSK